MYQITDTDVVFKTIPLFSIKYIKIMYDETRFLHTALKICLPTSGDFFQNDHPIHSAKQSLLGRNYSNFILEHAAGG